MPRKSSSVVGSSARLKTTVIAIAVALGLSLFGGEPQPAEARPITCTVSATSTLPSKSQFRDLVESLGEVNTWNIYAPVSSRCRTQLGKGQYLYRAQWTVRLQLSKGWPIGVDYSESLEYDEDAYMQTSETSFFSTPANGFAPPPYENFEGSYFTSQAISGINESWLTELCVGERCTFSTERTGQYGSVRSDAVPHIYTTVRVCMEYLPRGPEGEAETEDCGDSSSRKHAHPGTFGMQVTVSGTMTFEPLWTWRR